MLQQVIDRRLAGKNKSIGNRERFLRRFREQIRDAVRRAVTGRSIHDIDQGEDITLPKRDVSEPAFAHGQGGVRDTVHPGNNDYVRGDHIARPPSGGAGGPGQGASQDGTGEDDFVFRLTREEFMQYFFDDLALPNLMRTQLLPDAPEWKSRRAGFVSDGTPTNLSVVRSMRVALSRRIALGGETRHKLRELEALLEDELRQSPSAIDDISGDVSDDVSSYRLQIETLRRRLKAIPFFDPFDLRYRNRVKVPLPTSKAAMFCLMDVSGSMDEGRKELAKKFFILLHMFLRRHYEKTDVIFIRHHTQATEVTEEEFFHSVETGGTVASSALTLMHQIIQARYPSSEWNIFGAQASDGDNWYQDSAKCRQILVEKLLPVSRYFAYMQVAEEDQNLWNEYSQVVHTHTNFAMRKIIKPAEIYPIFRELFKKGVNT